jgi:hypothetical protein
VSSDAPVFVALESRKNGLSRRSDREGQEIIEQRIDIDIVFSSPATSLPTSAGANFAPADRTARAAADRAPDANHA